MSKIAIITDSTSCMPEDLVNQYNISVIPQVLVWGEETFRDGVDITPTEFYQRLAKASVMPSSSQASPAAFITMFQEKLDQGYQVLAILISAKLSGTMDSAIQAKEAIGSEDIAIVDSRSTAMDMGFHILEAARAAGRGASLAECKAVAEAAQQRSGVLITVETLEFLHRGGRIGGGARFLGTALNIKPILEIVDGRLEAVERVRTRSKAVFRLLELVAERTHGKNDIHMCALHANAEKDAQDFLAQASQNFNLVEKYIADVSPVIGTHVGPGTLGVTYMISD